MNSLNASMQMAANLQILSVDVNPFDPREDEYRKNGLLYCKKCRTERCSEIDGRLIRHICDCQEQQRDRKERENKSISAAGQFKSLQENSLIGERYKDCMFSNTDITDPNFRKAFERCVKFCQAHREVKSRGYGMYMHGTHGVGKTHLTACMANELMNNFNSVVLINFFEIAKEIKKTFSKSSYSESELINKLARVDFLFIDDIGTERVQRDGEDTWLQEKIYDVINKRYNARKPTVFTSNHTMQQLIEERGFMVKTVSRIEEMSTAVVKLSSQNYRKNISKEQSLF